MVKVVPSYLVVFICVQKGVWCILYYMFLLFMQEEHAKASTVAIPTSAKDIVIEPQAPINKKSQAKALTPPVSLITFSQSPWKLLIQRELINKLTKRPLWSNIDR